MIQCARTQGIVFVPLSSQEPNVDDDRDARDTKEILSWHNYLPFDHGYLSLSDDQSHSSFRLPRTSLSYRHLYLTDIFIVPTY